MEKINFFLSIFLSFLPLNDEGEIVAAVMLEMTRRNLDFAAVILPSEDGCGWRDDATFEPNGRQGKILYSMRPTMLTPV